MNGTKTLKEIATDVGKHRRDPNRLHLELTAALSVEREDSARAQRKAKTILRELGEALTLIQRLAPAKPHFCGEKDRCVLCTNSFSGTDERDHLQDCAWVDGRRFLIKHGQVPAPKTVPIRRGS